MPEYYLRILGPEIVTKRMVAEDHDVAIRAAIKWEGHNPDMDLTCGVQRIAARRKSVWLLRPDAGCEEDEAFVREAMDDFTLAAGWAGPGRSEDPGGNMNRSVGLDEPNAAGDGSLRRTLSRWLGRSR